MDSVERFHAASFLALFAALVGDLALTVYHAATGQVWDLNTDLLIACTLAALLIPLIGTVRPRQRR